MYCFKITKRPFRETIVSGFIGSHAIGIGIKNNKLYKCYSDEYVHDWTAAWGIDNAKPESFGFRYIPDISNFSWYINLAEGIIE